MGKRQRGDTDADDVTGKRISNGYGRPYSVLASPVMSLSSQSDNEADIVWGHSPPPMNLKLCSTPGPKTRRRSDYSSRDIADMIECINSRNSSQKQSPNVSTPPLLGLWMQDRPTNVQTTPVHTKGGQRFSRRTSNRRPPGESWASLAKDLHMLAELSQTSRIPPTTPDRESEEGEFLLPDDQPSDQGCSTAQPVGAVIAPSVSKDPVEETWVIPEMGKQEQSEFGKSLTEDMWEDDSWFENESFVSIATQLEEQACSQKPNDGPGLDSVSNRVSQNINEGLNVGSSVTSSSEQITKSRPAQEHQFLRPPKVSRTINSSTEIRSAKSPGCSMSSKLRESTRKQSRKTFQFSKTVIEPKTADPPPTHSDSSQCHGSYSSDETSLLSKTSSSTKLERESPKKPISTATGKTQFNRACSLGNFSRATAVTPVNGRNSAMPLLPATRKTQFGKVVDSSQKTSVNNSNGFNHVAKMDTISKTRISPPLAMAKNQFGKVPNPSSYGKTNMVNQGSKSNAHTEMEVTTGAKPDPREQTAGKSPESTFIRKQPSPGIGSSQFSKAGKNNNTLAKTKNGYAPTLSKVDCIGVFNKKEQSPKQNTQSAVPLPSSSCGQFNKARRLSATFSSSNIPDNTVPQVITGTDASISRSDVTQVSPVDPNGSMDLFDSSLGDDDAVKSDTSLKDNASMSEHINSTKLGGKLSVEEQTKRSSRRESDLFSESSFMDEDVLAAVELEEKNWELLCSQRVVGNKNVKSNTDSPSKNGMMKIGCSQFKKTPVKNTQDVSNRVQVRGNMNSFDATVSRVPSNQSGGGAKFEQFKTPLASQFSFSTKSVKDKGPTNKGTVPQFGPASVRPLRSGGPGVQVPKNPTDIGIQGGCVFQPSPKKVSPFPIISTHTLGTSFGNNDASGGVAQNKRNTFQFSANQFKRGEASPMKSVSQFSGPEREKPTPNSSTTHCQFEPVKSIAKPGKTDIQVAPLTSATSQFKFKPNLTKAHPPAAPVHLSNSILNSSSFSQTSSQFSAGSQPKTMDDSTCSDVPPSPVFAASDLPPAMHKGLMPVVDTITAIPKSLLNPAQNIVNPLDNMKSAQFVKSTSMKSNNKLLGNNHTRVPGRTTNQVFEHASVEQTFVDKSSTVSQNSAGISGNNFIQKFRGDVAKVCSLQFSRTPKPSPKKCLKLDGVGTGISRDVDGSMREQENKPSLDLRNNKDRMLSEDCIGPFQSNQNTATPLGKKGHASQFAKKVSPDQSQKSPPSSNRNNDDQTPRSLSSATRTLSGSAHQQQPPQFNKMTVKVMKPAVETTTTGQFNAGQQNKGSGRLTCSQEEIERKRREALARKKQNLLGSHRMSLRNRPIKES